jgi:HEPN domain-containing protein
MLSSGRYLYVAFMCQQAIEKLTKGLYVLYIGEEPPKTHNIWYVFSSIFNKDIDKHLLNDNAFLEKQKEYKPLFVKLHVYYIS